MRVAIATDGRNVGAHFGRCPSYTVVDIDGTSADNRQTLDNPGHAPGAIPKFLKEHGVEAIIAGGMGRRAQDLFDQMGIEHVVGVTGSVDDAIERCVDGTLEGGESLCSHIHGQGHDCEHHGGHE
jgi:predicted Fe-Mo cluster-binding NifX family protein